MYQEALQTLMMNIQGHVVLPGDAAYEAGREVWYGTVERHPALIVYCAGADDVMAAVTFAHQQGLDISVRSGGHSPAGYSINDDGMIIDLSRMKAITIDPEQRIARLEAGLTWAEVAEALQPHGLALTSGDTGSVGVGGLMLGGGIGWMARKYGMTIDHLRAVELVTADGEFLRASADEHPELFWGLRGGGGNFGIATAFEVNVDPVGMVLGGAVFYDIAEAAHILPTYAHYAAAAPDELTTMAMLMVAPPAPFIPPQWQGKPALLIFVCYTGDLTEGQRVVAPLQQLGTPIADVIAPIPYPVMFAFSHEATIRGLRQYTRSMFARTASDELLQAIAESASLLTPQTIVQMRILGGAMSRVDASATAFAHRDKQVMLSVFNSGPHSPETERSEANAAHIWQALHPYAEGVYVNFLENEGRQRVYAAYSPATYERLATLKHRYDPTNLFHLNQNILPVRTGQLVASAASAV